MLNKNTIDQFYKDVEELGLRFPVAAITKATGFNKGTVSEYLNKKKEPSNRFLDAFYEKFGKSLKNVPREKNGHVVVGQREKVSSHDALLSVLVTEIASLKASATGEHLDVLIKKIYKAAEDVAKLGEV